MSVAEDYLDGQDPPFDEDVEDHVICKFCFASVYWADHYGPRGDCTRKLFDADRKRLHVCTGTQPDANAFPKV
jgi:hypothetical protein